MKVGFIGLGNMGGPMALRLVANGHDVAGFDVSGKVPAGVQHCGTIADVVANKDAVITMLPNGSILADVYKTATKAAFKGTVFVDCSTVNVVEARLAAELAVAEGCEAIDAPVSGGTAGAAAGTLTFMVGGAASTLKRVQPLFDAMGSRTVHCGASGTGQAAKICNNMILGITMIGVCEAFNLAKSLGLDQQRLFDVASVSSGSCWSLNTYCPVPGIGPVTPADRDYAPGFAAELMLKDLALSQQAAESVSVATPLGQAAMEFYEEYVGSGGRGRDFSAALLHLASMKRE